jgi:hypothetical protein
MAPATQIGVPATLPARRFLSIPSAPGCMTVLLAMLA